MPQDKQETAQSAPENDSQAGKNWKVPVPKGGDAEDDGPPPRPVTDSDHYYKRRHEADQKRIKELERASLSETERLRSENAELAKERDTFRSELTETRNRSKFETEAKKAGVRDPEAAWLLTKSNINFTEDGRMVGLEKALQGLKESRSYLFENAGGLGSKGGNTKAADAGKTVNQKMNDFIRGRRG